MAICTFVPLLTWSVTWTLLKNDVDIALRGVCTSHVWHGRRPLGQENVMSDITLDVDIYFHKFAVYALFWLTAYAG
jgi:hypothetical protein